MRDLSTDEIELLRLIFGYESILDYDILRFRTNNSRGTLAYDKYKYSRTYREFLECGGTFELLLKNFIFEDLFIDVEDMNKDYDELQEKGIVTLLSSIMIDL